MSEIVDVGTRGGRFVDVTRKERRTDLLKVLQRGLNTWGCAPAWLVRLYDELQKERDDGNQEQPR